MTNRDPDFDPIAAPRLATPYYDPNPEDALRILANPFLSMILGFGALKIAPKLADVLGVWVLPLAVATGLGMLLSLQYHCLDCGSTGNLFRWKQHVCPAVRERRHLGISRRFRGPRPILQVCLWYYLLLGFLVVAHSLRWF